jgi:hypothetical protein
MSAPVKELLRNFATTNLDGSIDNSVTSIDVDDGSVFPSTGNFRVKVEDEIMLVTARSSDTLTVVRGSESTAAASHGDNTVITLILTNGSLTEYNKDAVPLWGLSTQPALKLVADDGQTLLTTADWTWANQGSASVSDQGGTIVMRAPTASGENVRVQYKSAPSAPYVYQAAFRWLLPAGSSDVALMVFGFRKNSDGKLSALAFQTHTNGGFWQGQNVLSVYNWNTPTSFNSTGLGVRFCNIYGPEIWIKIEDDNTNLKWYIGDGTNYALIHSMGRTAFMSGGPDQIFWGLNNFNNADYEILCRMMAFQRVS